MSHDKTHPAPRPGTFWLALFLAACFLAVQILAAAPALAEKDSPNPAVAERRDNVMGTIHEGLTMESGPGQDAVTLISPPPEPLEAGEEPAPTCVIKQQVDPQDYSKQ